MQAVTNKQGKLSKSVTPDVKMIIIHSLFVNLKLSYSMLNSKQRKEKNDAYQKIDPKICSNGVGILGKKSS